MTPEGSNEIKGIFAVLTLIDCPLVFMISAYLYGAIDVFYSILSIAASKTPFLGANVFDYSYLTTAGLPLFYLSVTIMIIYSIAKWLKSRSSCKAGITPDLPFMNKLFSDQSHYSYRV